MTLICKPASSTQNASKEYYNNRCRLLQTPTKECVAAFLSLRDLQSFGLTCVRNTNNILGRGWVPTAQAPVCRALLPTVEMSRYSPLRPMYANEFLDYEKLYTTDNRSFPEMRYLNLQGLSVLRERLSTIIHKTPHLITFSLAGMDKLTNRGMELVAFLTDLQFLELYDCRKVSDLTPLSHCAVLTGLDLGLCINTSDSSLSSLSNLPLQNLSLNRCSQITGSGLGLLKKARLISLNLECCQRFSDVGMSMLPKFPLRNLKLSYCTGITSAGWKYLAQLPELVSLDLSGCTQLTDDDLLNVTHLPHLRTLSFTGCPNITEKGLKYLEHLPARITFSTSDKISLTAWKNFTKNQEDRLDVQQKTRGVKRQFNED